MSSIIFGIIMIVGGLSGELVLIGTNSSSSALVGLGAVLVFWGLFRVISRVRMNQAVQSEE
ncbi:MAG: hypothetical protein PF961_15130 [Planctomycetota bacterium]|jgi:hypothetical protein|nr:hypothetical protein [Planctomycetota bacterium]